MPLRKRSCTYGVMTRLSNVARMSMSASGEVVRQNLSLDNFHHLSRSILPAWRHALPPFGWPKSTRKTPPWGVYWLVGIFSKALSFSNLGNLLVF